MLVLAEKESNDDVASAQRLPIPCIVSGAISSPTDVDYYAFSCTKGQRILAYARTASIDSPLMARLEFFDNAGKLLASRRPMRRQDALLDFTAPVGGEYFLRVSEYTHAAGGPDFRYHLAVGAFPYIDAAFPLAVEPGKKNKITLIGRNLPDSRPAAGAVENGSTLEETTLILDVPKELDHRAPAFSEPQGLGAALLPSMEVRVRNAYGTSNGVALLLAKAPVLAEMEPNDTPEKPQAITPPCEISGRLDHKSDHDWYSWRARKGDVFTVELWSERLGAPTDLKLTIQEAASKRTLAGLEDNGDNLDVVLLAYAQRRSTTFIAFKASSDGVYLAEEAAGVQTDKAVSACSISTISAFCRSSRTFKS